VAFQPLAPTAAFTHWRLVVPSTLGTSVGGTDTSGRLNVLELQVGGCAVLEHAVLATYCLTSS
jgi:hypothetical protein